ncbi:hypothetical protein [uncultured Cyclobacterium sp.]|uniref:hypothetical protein n=1 Tax=uncultured Cyclobacterium sp. TaxID=453820 RepID=UPI0030EF51AB
MVVPKITETLVNDSNFINLAARNPVTPVRTAKNNSMGYIRECNQGPGNNCSISHIMENRSSEKMINPTDWFFNNAFI